MVTIVDYRISKNAEGEQFVSLILEGDLTMVQSQETGSWYATSKRCSITSTFDEVKANKLIGMQIPGSIARIECEPYEYILPESGEVVELSHTYRYEPSPVSVEEQAVLA